MKASCAARIVRSASSSTPLTQALAPEKYPNTRSSNAVSVRAKYFLPYRAAIDTMYRFYTDTWGVLGHTAELGYVHPTNNERWIFEGRVRYYTQTAADFYQDIFPRADYANFMARDKELATYTRDHRRPRRHVRVQDRAVPVAHQGRAQPALRLHERRTTTISAMPRTASAVSARRRMIRWHLAPSRCTSSTPTSSSSSSRRISRYFQGLRPTSENAVEATASVSVKRRPRIVC